MARAIEILCFSPPGHHNLHLYICHHHTTHDMLYFLHLQANLFHRWTEVVTESALDKKSRKKHAQNIMVSCSWWSYKYTKCISEKDWCILPQSIAPEDSTKLMYCTEKSVLFTRGSATGRALDLRSVGRGFKSYARQCCLTTLGKLFTPMCLCHQAV